MKTFLLSPEEKDPTNVSITESQIDLSFQYTQTFLINKQWNKSILMKHFISITITQRYKTFANLQFSLKITLKRIKFMSSLSKLMSKLLGPRALTNKPFAKMH